MKQRLQRLRPFHHGDDPRDVVARSNPAFVDAWSCVVDYTGGADATPSIIPSGTLLGEIG